MTDLGFLIARAMLAVIYILSGYAKLTAVAGIAKMLGDKGFPMPVAFGYATGAVEFVGGLLLLIGFQARWAALVLFAFTAGTIVIGHNFWVYEGAQYMAQRTQALKNLGIMGGFLMVVLAGPGRLSLDRR